MTTKLTAIAAAAALLAAGALLPSRADAMSLPAPAGIAAALDAASLSQDVAYVCNRIWRCGYYGCGWRRVCWWRPGGYYYRPYRYYRRHW